MYENVWPAATEDARDLAYDMAQDLDLCVTMHEAGDTRMPEEYVVLLPGASLYLRTDRGIAEIEIRPQVYDRGTFAKSQYDFEGFRVEGITPSHQVVFECFSSDIMVIEYALLRAVETLGEECNRDD